MIRVVIGPGFPFPIEPPVRFDNRNNFRRRSGEETFVGDKNIMASDIGLQ